MTFESGPERLSQAVSRLPLRMCPINHSVTASTDLLFLLRRSIPLVGQSDIPSYDMKSGAGAGRCWYCISCIS